MRALFLSGRTHPQGALPVPPTRSERTGLDFETVVLGGGISGMVAASVLLRQKRGPLLLLDEYDRLGGNHIDVAVGPYTFDIGSFFFSDGAPFFSHFPDLRSEYLPVDYTIGRIAPSGCVTAYPFSIRDDVMAGGPLEVARILLSLAKARFAVDPTRSALAFAEYWLGRHFVESSGLEPFLRRFYGVEPQRIEAAFARKRMGWVSKQARPVAVLNLLLGRRSEPQPQQLVRPRSGFVPLYARAGEAIVAMGGMLCLGAPIISIRRAVDGSFRLETPDGIISARSIVSTIPVGRLLHISGLPPAQPLEVRALTSLFYSFKGNRGFDYNVLYNFTRDGRWKRLTVHSDFYGEAEGRMFFTAEVLAPIPRAEIHEEAILFERHVRRHGLFDGDLKLESTRVTEQAYPIYLHGATQAAEQAVARLRAFGITSFGRQGGFDYQPTSAVSARVAEAALGEGSPRATGPGGGGR